MVDLSWDVFFWSTLGPGWGNKGSQKPCWWKEKVEGGGTRRDQRGKGDVERMVRPEKRKRDQPGLVLGYSGPS